MSDAGQTTSPDDAAPKSRRRDLRPGGRWTIQHVAKFLNCSDDHALRWLREKGIELFNIGTGAKSVYRVERKSVLAAYHASRVEQIATDKASTERPVGYVPRYFKPGWQAPPGRD